MIIKKNVPIKHLCSFAHDGILDQLYIAENIQDLQFIIQNKKPYFILGKGSNTLINPQHRFAAVVQLSPTFYQPDFQDNLHWLGANMSIHQALRYLKEEEVSGLEFSAGIPASIGGMIYMNFSCWNHAISDHIQFVDCLDAKGNRLLLNKKNSRFGYRYSHFQDHPYIILRAGFKFQKSTQQKIENQIQHYLSQRKATHPIHKKTFGSIFKNPIGKSSGKLLDELKLKDQLILTNVKLSQQHANFLINNGNASFDCVKSSLEKIEKAVLKITGLKLEREVILLN